MAKIEKIYEDAERDVQMYPQTHEKAVVDDNGTTLESKIGMITDLINQKQMGIGAVPSDLNPTSGSVHWVTSDGIFIYCKQFPRKGNIEIHASFALTLGMQHTPGNGIRTFYRNDKRITNTNDIDTSALNEYNYAHIPSGYLMAIVRTDTTSETTSTDHYVSTGWQEGTFALPFTDKPTFIYAAINFKRTDEAVMTNADLTALESGFYLSKVGEEAFVNGDGDFMSFILENPLGFEEIHVDYAEMPFTVVSGVHTPASGMITSKTRCTMQGYFRYDNVKYFTKIIVPQGYDFTVNSFLKESGNDLDTETKRSGWQTGTGEPYTITTLTPEFTYFCVNFRLPNDGIMSSSDITALQNGVVWYREPQDVDGAKQVRFVDEDNTAETTLVATYGSGNVNVYTKNAVDSLVGNKGIRSYNGERIVLNQIYKFNFSLFNTLPSAVMVQSFAIYDKYMVRCMYSGSTLSAYLYDLETNTLLHTFTLPYGNMTIPHCNTAVFGKEFASGNTDLPLLYLSQWNGEHGCLVYDIHLDGTASLVQTITPSVSTSIWGAGNGDWVVDTDNSYIYSVAYKVDGSAVTEANGQRAMICKFRLPRISDGASVVFTDNDVIEYFDVPPFNVMQDKCYNSGHIFIAAGGGTSYDSSWNRIYNLSIGEKAVVSVISTYQLKQSEPEGLDIYDSKLMLSFNSSPYGEVYQLEF